MKTVACIIARTVSTRLPLKVLRSVYDDVSMLDFMINRLKQIQEIDEIFLCTSAEPVDDILEDIAEKNIINIYRGSADKVIERMLDVAQITKADNVIRITGDNVFTSFEYIGQQINSIQKFNLDYCRIINVPIGATAEVIKVSALKDCYASMDASVSEYLLLFIFNPDKYKCGVLEIDRNDYSSMIITVDTPNDLKRTKEILKLYPKEKLQIKLLEIIKLIQTNNIPDSYYLPSGDVKLPYNKIVSFAEFQNDMKNRIANSLKIKLNE
jgi:spore coat polysaccharide biosynthesis protein SpsF